MADSADTTILGRRITRIESDLSTVFSRLDRLDASIAKVDSHVWALTRELHDFRERFDRFEARTAENFGHLVELLTKD